MTLVSKTSISNIHLYNYLTLNYLNKTNNSVPNTIGSNKTRSEKNVSKITCPNDISTYTDLNSCTSYISDFLNIDYPTDSLVRLTWEMTGASTDASESAGINQINEYEFNEGITTVTYTAEDQSGNISSCSFSVTITDNQVPRLEAIPGDITVQTAPGECSAPASWHLPVASDNCTPTSEIIIEGSAAPGSVFPVGETTVYYHAYDAMGNQSATHSFTVTVKDNEFPQLVLPDEVSIKCEEAVPPSWQNLQDLFNAGGFAADNCEIDASSFHLLSETSDAETCPFTITRTYEVSDIHGNKTSAQYLIHVAAPAQGTPVLKSGTAEITALGGNWSAASTWPGGIIPGPADDVIIPAGVTVTIDAAAFCNNITIESGGTLNYSGAYSLQVNGNWTNNGTYNGGTSGVVEFSGNTAATINGNTTFEELIVSKGNLSSTLTITGNVTVNSGGSFTFNSGLITIGSGGSLSIDPSNGITIPETAGFDVTGGTLTTGNFSITNNGLIRVTSGTANLGTNSGNTVHTQVDGAFIVTNGNVNIAGRLENTASGTLNPPGVSSGIHISGGTVTLATAGNGLSNVGSLNVTSAGTFDFSGGIIVFQTPSTAATELDLGLIDGNGTKNTTGGTFQFGNGSTPAGATFDISSEIPLDNITSASGANLVLNSDLLVNQLNLNSGSSIDLSGNALQIAASGLTTYNFPLDDGNGNAIPVIVNLTSGSNFDSGDYIGITTAGSIHPQNANNANFLNRYWTVTINGISNPSYSINANYSAGDIANAATNLIVGNYTSSWNEITGATIAGNTVSFSSTSTDLSFSILEEPTVTITNTTNPEVICDGSSVTLTTSATGDPGLTYLWSSNPSTSISANTGSSVTVAPPANPSNSITNYTYTVTVTDGNGFSASDNIGVTVNPLPTVSITGTNSPICSDENATFDLNGTPNATITYTINSGTNQTISLNSSGTATVTISAATANQTLDLVSVENNSTGCSQNLSVTSTINVNPLPTATISGDNTICEGETSAISVNLTGTPPWSITYQRDGANDVTENTINSTPYTFNVSEAGVYTISALSDANCTGTTLNGSAAITVDPTSVGGTIAGETSVCSGTNSTTLALSGYVGTIQKWEATTDGTNWTDIANTSDTYTATNLTETTSYRAVVKNGICNESNSDVATITTEPQPIAIAGGTNEICAGGTVTISDASSNYGMVQWTHNGNGSLIDENGLTPTYISDPLDAGKTVILTLTVTSQNTCSPIAATATHTINVFDCIPKCATKTICTSATWQYTSIADFIADGGQINFPCSVPDTNIKLINSTSTTETCPQIITQTYEIWDECGNKAQCEAQITLEDTEPPALSGIPADVDLLCENPPDPPELYTEITATDNCDNDVEITYEEISTQKFDNSYESVVYTVTRKWTATDDCGNSTYDEQTINVRCEYCSNMIDDDGDGLIDENDPKCPCSSPSYKLDCNANQFYFIPPVWQMNPSYGVYTDPSSLVISTPFGSANINIRTADGTTYNQSFTVNQGTALEIPLTDDLVQTPNYNTKEKNRGLIIESDQLIQVVYRITATNNKLMVTIKGEQALGQWFRVGSQTNVCGAPNTSKRENHFISVMAVEDNTTISFDFKADMKGLGSTETITLDAGETYLMIDNDKNQTVTGSLIVANKTIAVISGSQHSRQCVNESGHDGGVDQLVPTCVIGSNYVVSRGADNNNPSTSNYAVIVGVTSNTEITIDGSVKGTIGPGDYYTYNMPSPDFSNHYIQTSEPAYVYQFGSLQDNGEIGMAVASPIDGCRGDRYIEFYKYPDVNVNNTTFIIPDSGLSSFTLNGNNYSTYGVIPQSIPGLSNWSTITFGESDMTNYNIVQSDEYFIAYQFVGDNAGGTMGYLTSFKDKIDIFHPDTGEKTYEYFVDTICAGQTYQHTINASSCSGDQFISAFIGGGNTEGYKIYPDSKTFEYTPKTGYTGEDNITLIVADKSGLSQPVCLSFYVCGDPPTITCPDNIVASSDPNECFATGIDPGIPLTTGGCFASEVLNVISDAPEQFLVGENIITWTVRDSCGNEATCEQTVIVNDNESPSFTSYPIENCVDMLYSVVYNANNPNPNSGADPNLIKNPSPDFYTFKAGDTSLDITDITDNCCAPEDMIIHWQIDFTDTPDPLNPTGTMLTHASISGTGQPSNYGNDILFPGDGVNFTEITHIITYWLEDCNGNTPDSQIQNIVITPRPRIIKQN